MKQDIENIIKKWLKEHKDGGQWVSDYDGEFDLDSCCLDGNFNLNELADEVLKVVVEKIMEVKYSSHNPTIDCTCETCFICNKLLDNFKK